MNFLGANNCLSREYLDIIRPTLSLSGPWNKQIPCLFQGKICSSTPAKERGRRLALGRLPTTKEIVSKSLLNNSLINFEFYPFWVAPLKACTFFPRKDDRNNNSAITVNRSR